ncbi:MAG: hypothetical protein JXA00_04815 [Candidatus Thermoplasmatota archaeon]|nr:hypothetical protein [Candidatus Thermoplasmatota archaeon]
MMSKKILILGVSGILLYTALFAGALYIHYYTPSLHLPDATLTMYVTDGNVSYFNIYLSDVPAGYEITDGLYVGWCADRGVTMPRNQNLQVKLFNSYALFLPEPLQSRNWSKVNYILNHKGNATKADVQDAIWNLINRYPFSSISENAKQLVNTAHDGYKPQEGGLIAILALPVYPQHNQEPFQRSFLEVRLPPQEGKTPGFWKNHVEDWPEGYTKETSVTSVFVNASLYFPNTDTLLDALDYQGGTNLTGAAESLLRAAVAAVLNARHPCINYPILESTVIEEVNIALGSQDRDTMLNLKDILEECNELEADLNQ